jgi:hypothetical protein
MSEEIKKPDVFRKEYRQLSDLNKSWMNEFKDLALVLHDSFDKSLSELPQADKRHMSLAKTSLENAIMWAVKSVT